MLRRNTNMNAAKTVTVALLAGAVAFAGARPAQAGHGSSPGAIQNAIASGSVDAIQAELERAEYLVCSGCTDMVLPLVDHLDYRVRRVAAWWLVRRATSQQVYLQMLNRLSQPDSTAARNAADVLGEFGFPSAVPALGAALSNPIFSGEARAAMAKALGSIDRPEATAPLVAALADTNPLVQAGAVVALRNVTGFRDPSVALPLLGAADQQVRSEAAVTVGMMGTLGRSDASVNALVTALADQSPLVRRRAAWALGQVAAPAAVAGAPLQTAASSDASPVVRSLAQAAIARLTR
jgi:HEAT repeat protein